MQLRRFADEYCDGPFGSAIKSDHYSTTGARVVRLGDIGSGEWKSGVPAFLDLDYWATLDRHHVLPGDLLVAGLGDENNPVGRATVAPDLGPALVKADCYRFRLDRSKAEPRFIARYLSSSAGLDYSGALADGSTRKRLTIGKALAIPVPLPRLAEQRAIADYLDTETTRIDALIAKKRRMIELLEARLRAVVDWFTNGPSVPLRRVVERFVDYRGATPEKSTTGVPLVTATHVKKGRIDLSLDPQFIGVEAYHAWMRRGWPSIDDVIMTTEAPLGEVAWIDDPEVALAQRLILMKVHPARMDSRFLGYAMRSGQFRAALFAYATGSTALGIKADRLKGLPVSMPDLASQAAAVRKIGNIERQVRRQQQLIERQIDLLVERRQALITAAVTGELEVPGVAA